MAYFLKVSKQQSRTYLSIYESFYDPEKKGTRHRSYRFLGNLDKLIASGIEDPIAYYKKEVDKLNEKRKQEKTVQKPSQKQISERSPERSLGYFPLTSIMNVLDVEEHFHHMQSTRRFRFDLYRIFCALVYARAVAPYSKYRTFHEVLPSLFMDIDFSYDQMMEAIAFLGSEYEKFVEIFTVATQENYGVDASRTYFDCTNFYFEIDKENDFQKKGPSKENRKDPIIGMGLLLDAGMIPIGMKLYPGNQSEKPVLRDTISDLKKRNNIRGRTIQVADKGLNCSRNIIEAIERCDGYIFSKSIRGLSEKERIWALKEDGFTDVKDHEGNLIYSYKSCIDDFTYEYEDDDGRKIRKTVREKRLVTFNPKLARKKHLEINKMVEKAQGLSRYAAKKNEYGESAKYVNFISEDGGKVKTALNEEAIEKDRRCAGYNLLVTSEYRLSEEEIYQTYHNLWRIEESFRVMKSELDARPVYAQREETIKGHFLIVYITVLLTRILQFKVLKDEFSTTKLCEFYRSFKVVDIGKGRYINVTRSSAFIRALAERLDQPITNYYLNDKQIKMMHTR